MTVTVVRNPGTSSPIAPDGITDYSSSRQTGNKVHVLLNNAGPPAYDLNPSGYRTGSFTLVFKSRSAAFACEAAHAVPARFTLADSTVSQVGMVYVLADGQAVELRPSPTAAAWLVTIPFQEVAS